MAPSLSIMRRGEGRDGPTATSSTGSKLAGGASPRRTGGRANGCAKRLQYVQRAGRPAQGPSGRTFAGCPLGLRRGRRSSRSGPTSGACTGANVGERAQRPGSPPWAAGRLGRPNVRVRRASSKVTNGPKGPESGVGRYCLGPRSVLYGRFWASDSGGSGEFGPIGGSRKVEAVVLYCWRTSKLSGESGTRPTSKACTGADGSNVTGPTSKGLSSTSVRRTGSVAQLVKGSPVAGVLEGDRPAVVRRGATSGSCTGGGAMGRGASGGRARAVLLEVESASRCCTGSGGPTAFAGGRRRPFGASSAQRPGRQCWRSTCSKADGPTSRTCTRGRADVLEAGQVDGPTSGSGRPAGALRRRGAGGRAGVLAQRRGPAPGPGVHRGGSARSRATWTGSPASCSNVTGPAGGRRGRVEAGQGPGGVARVSVGGKACGRSRAPGRVNVLSCTGATGNVEGPAGPRSWRTCRRSGEPGHVESVNRAGSWRGAVATSGALLGRACSKVTGRTGCAAGRGAATVLASTWSGLRFGVRAAACCRARWLPVRAGASLKD